VQNTSTVSLSGTASVGAPFSVVAGGSFSLAAGASQTVTVRFQPTTAGTFTGNVNFTAGGTTLSRGVSGTATAPAPVTLSVTKNGTGTGTVTSAPAGIACGTDCSETAAGGTQFTLTATAAAGSTFAGWSGPCTGTAATCAVALTAATTVTATFNSSLATPAPGSPSGLVAAYTFNETSGSTVADASGNNNTGSLSAGVTRTTQGRFGGALVFNGAGLVTVPHSASLNLTSGMTLQAWVFPTGPLSAWSTLILKEQPGDLAYALYAGSPNNRPSVYFNSDRSVGGPAALPLNTWSHVAGTFDGSTLRFYVNGTLVASRAHAGSIVTSTRALRFGGNTIWSEYFQGRLDEIRLYNRALSPAEIQIDMNAPVGGPSGLGG
jgi:hypothetical protein